MRVPAVSVVSKIMIVAVVGLLACALMPLGSAFAEGKEAPSALLASSLMDGSASVVREDVTLAAPEGDAVPEPVIGSFTVDGLTFAVLDESHVELVGVAPSVTLSEAAEGGVVEEPNESRASEAGATNLALPESVTYEGVSYALASIAPYAFYLSGVADVTLPASVSDVDDRAFRSSDMANVMVAEGNPTYSSFDGALYDASQSSLLLIPEGKQGAVRIPKTAEVAEASVFSHCPLVDSISVDAGSAAFASENGLLYTSDLTTLLRVPAGATDITIREGCTTIAAAAMEVCVSLERINAPASVTSISPYLFEQEPETVVAPVAFAAKDEDGGSTESGPSQISSVVALHDVLDLSGFPDPSTIDLALNERSDVALWKKVGFILEDGHSDDGNGGMASMLPALSQKTALPNYDSVEGLPPIVDGVQSAATYASYSTMSHMLQSGITGAAVFVITSCVTESGNLKPGDCFDDKIGQGYTPETYWMNLSGASFELERGDGCRIYGYVEAKPGYTFKGWASSPFGTPSQSFSRTDYASGGSGAFTYTHYAIFETNTYTITLNTYGASPYNDNSWTEVIANSLYTKTYNIRSEKITLPFVLRSGYYFAGWIGANGTTPAMSVTVDKGSFGDKSYTASYEKIHTVTYSSAHGTPERPHDSIYQSNSTVTLPDIPSVDLGFEFNGWESPVWTGYKKAGDVVTFTDTENVTVTASFTKTEYAITLDTQGGSVSGLDWNQVSPGVGDGTLYDRVYTVESDDIILPTPSLTGYTFTGWTGSNGTTPQPSVTIAKGTTGDKEYTANYTLSNYTITLDTQGGSVSDSSWKAVTANSKYTKSYTKDSDKIELPTPSRQGYYFKGWSGPGLSFPQMTVVIDTGSTEDRTYTANWGDPGTITIHLAEDLASKKIFKYMKPSTQGIQGDGTGAPFGTSMPGRSLFPVGRDQYGITLANTMYLALEGQHFNSWPVADFCNKGYLYDVAYCCINGGNLFEPSVGWSYTAAGDESIDVYVTQGTACKVTWDANGGTLEDDGGAEVSTRTDWRGKGKGISAPFPMRRDYVCTGWYDAPNGGTKVAEAGEEVVLSESRTLYAQWARPGTVTIYSAEDPASTADIKYLRHDGAPLASRKIEDIAGGSWLTKPMEQAWSLWPLCRDQYGFLVGVGEGSSPGRDYVALKEAAGFRGLVSDAQSKGHLYDVAYYRIDGGSPIKPGANEVLPAIVEGHNIDVYVTQGTACKVTWDANGGTLEDDGGAEVSTRTDWVGSASSYPTPIPIFKGFACTGWYTDPIGGDRISSAGGPMPTITSNATFYAHWTPAISVDVPIEVTAEVDLLGIEDQVPASGYIESRCGAPLAVEEVSFTALPGAADLFGAANTASVSLQALALEGDATWDASAPTFSFPLSANATESDASKLAAFRMEGYEGHIPIGYRFAIPDDVLAAIDPTRFENATTPVCSVAYTVALAR